MDDKNFRIRYCASVLSIPKKIIECGPLIVRNYKIKCDNNFEPFWYKIHVNDDIEKMRKIEKEIFMNKYCMEDFSYNSADEMYYKQMYDDEQYLLHGEKISDVTHMEEIIDKYNREQYDFSYDEIFYNEYNEINENKKKRNIPPLYIPSFKSMENLKRKESLNDEPKINTDNDTKKNKKIKPIKTKKENNYEYEYDDSNNDSYDDWSSPNFSEDEKTDEKKAENNESVDEYFDDYIY